jgi:hypothetical protein
MIVPQNGSRWVSSTSENVHVLSTIVIEGKTWIHYIEEGRKDPREHSCYLESFLERFKEIIK